MRRIPSDSMRFAMALLLFAAMAALLKTPGRCRSDEKTLWSVVDASRLLQAPSWSVAAVAAPWDALAHEALRVLAARNASAKLFDARSAAADGMMRSLNVRPPSLVVATRGSSRVFAIDDQLRADAVADAIEEARKEEQMQHREVENDEEKEAINLLHEKMERTSLVSVLVAMDCDQERWEVCHQLDEFVETHRLRTTVSILYAKERRSATTLLDRMYRDAGRSDVDHLCADDAGSRGLPRGANRSTCWSEPWTQNGWDWCQDGVAIVQGVYYLARKPAIGTYCARKDGFEMSVLRRQIQQSFSWRVQALLERELRFPFINPKLAGGSSHPSLLLLADLHAIGPVGALSRASLRAIDQLADRYANNINIDMDKQLSEVSTSSARRNVCTTYAPHMIFYHFNADSNTTGSWLAHWFQFSGELPAAVIVDPSIQEYYLLEADTLEGSLESGRTVLDTLQVYIDGFFRGALAPRRYEDDGSVLPEIRAGTFLRDLSPVKVEDICQRGWEILILYTSTSCGICKRYLAMFDFLETLLTQSKSEQNLAAVASDSFASALQKVRERGTLVLGAVDCDRFFCGLGVHPVIFFVGQERGQLKRFEGSPWLQHLLDFLLDMWEVCPKEGPLEAVQRSGET